MRKINQKEEKRAKNEEYALRFKAPKKSKGRQKSVFLNWCRTEGHAPSCRCVYKLAG